VVTLAWNLGAMRLSTLALPTWILLDATSERGARKGGSWLEGFHFEGAPPAPRTFVLAVLRRRQDAGTH
jgi:hypothetical protein